MPDHRYKGIAVTLMSGQLPCVTSHHTKSTKK